MKILLTGANGQLGRCFQDRLPADWQVWATDTADLDITDYEKVLTAVKEFQPDAIVNAAAYTAVDKAESEPELAALVNKTGSENLALAAKVVGAHLVHVSTDYVFDGNATVPYVETDKTNPLGVYGKTKLDGEIAVSTVLPDAIIMRTAWVFSEYGNNFVKTMLRLAKERDGLSIVSDQRGCPTYAGDIAQAIINLLKQNADGGIYHYCGDREVSWYEFAESIFLQAIEKGRLSKAPQLSAISTQQYSTPAKRPTYSTLNCLKITKLGVKTSNWYFRLKEII
ncbi:dTDP-4-dehydrorhamnose reductase [Pectobacterium versatile]|uniref:dTDP-4-dehydrorhamnose reductase n=2 Tax=Pectobacterium TaxID=122277 RepID=A0ABS0S3S9_PECPM|nr:MULTISPECIES: dTDP-4-dehydrorhamnose reductase [Pectobacterium]MBA0184074.1 dTDP-4-dehydrorhamnose reductase [Pectobacterium versatile]MBI0556528.1 dTDP-4-dehydrorhamnose reductase [Pectobacterium parmentieri]POD97479.1 dTDP-4-dehydrorhamnose reductase [Pectobacterium odoriferum]POE10484.1 dTDP-4-dehydrorhamnose reductase [Pectobacterium odoriferum]POE14347.1 dTDP-4-dehydrorhamnose reductase [Pectobacterium odoriferum]